MKLSPRFQQIWQQEEGASLVYVTLLLLVLVGFAGLAVDGSNAYLQRRRLQTAADAAALAGARSLAMAQNNSQISQEIQSMATTNGATTATWSAINSNRGVTVEANKEVETFFARALGVTSIPVAAEAAADVYSVVKTEKIFPLAIECDCVQYEPVDMVPVVNNFCASSQEVMDYHTWSIWLRDLDPLYGGLGENPDGWYYTTQDEFNPLTEYTNGTAQLSGRIVNADGHGFEVDILLEGRTSTEQIGSPDLPAYSVDTGDWYYYPELSGTLLGIPGGRYEGAVLTLSPRGPSFQVGTGASLWAEGDLGAAGGFTWVVTEQPTTGVTLSTGPGDGSINLQLEYCNDNSSDLNTVTSNECSFRWLDWTPESEATPSDLAIDINKLRSGSWQVYDWVSSGPDACDASHPNVQTALGKWENKEVTVVLFNDNVDEETAAEHPGQMQICGFARWKLLDYSTDGHYIEGTFVRGLVRGDPAPIEGDFDFGASDVQLQ